MTILSQHAFGIRCPSCGKTASRVLYKRRGKNYVRRRHECLNPKCHKARWTTYEFFSIRRGVIRVPEGTRAEEISTH